MIIVFTSAFDLKFKVLTAYINMSSDHTRRTTESTTIIFNPNTTLNDCGFICAGVNFVGGYK